MGQTDDRELANKAARTGRRSTRGSTDNSGRLAAFTDAREGGTADWGSCDPSRLQAVVVAISRMGGAVTLGLSRDGGAYSLTLLLESERTTLWFNGGADLDAELEKVRATLDAMT